LNKAKNIFQSTRKIDRLANRLLDLNEDHLNFLFKYGVFLKQVMHDEQKADLMFLRQLFV
jgi:hypothetical protein